MALYKKTVFAHVATSAGTHITEWHNIDFQGYSKTLNGGVGECVIRYAVPFDYDGDDLREGNDVQIVLRDGDTVSDPVTYPDGTRTIYKGYISLIEREMSGNAETVTVHLLGYYTRLAFDILKIGSQTTLYPIGEPPGDDWLGVDVAYPSVDIGNMMRTVVDFFIDANGPLIHYETDDIPETGTVSSYVFIQKTYREAIDVLKNLAPSNVYWYVDETGRFSFKEIPSSPTHAFVFGRHISQIHTERSLEKVRNIALVWNGDNVSTTYKHYEDAASIAAYGRRVERITDFGLVYSDGADALAAKFLAENKDPSIKVIVTIIDNNTTNDSQGYDIETIQPGHTCRFIGFSSTMSDILRDNMVITDVVYNLNEVRITVELKKSGLIDTQAQHGSKITELNIRTNLPTTYS